MLDILLDFLAYLGIRVLKKKKNKDTDSTSPDTLAQDFEKDQSERTRSKDVPVCSGCNQIVEKDTIYELGKVWCRDCYKTQVLKVHE